MRRFAAITLLFVFFLYHLGYYGFYLALSHQLDKQWNNKVYSEYLTLTAEELKHTSIPLSIPYQPDQQHYEPHSGKVEINGQYYRIVKQRYAQDTLHILYVNDSLQTDLDASVDEWIASMIQKPLNSDHQGIQRWKTLAKDFIIDEFWVLVQPKRLLASQPYQQEIVVEYRYHISIPSPPPRS
ncbi:hypothetical protein OKW21_002245 [Catalinimonas alkaloidigena]|uniref:hypothetical protein n=1 Tax=Catalinimonas alkaloidigena TaxID=1075417 RepID=UPI002406D231|nr:hypothetical protein [Catalinimonas alkaloidigena]MDF9796982.1 hypothetical protein [Catalinimonas alkaloidigena]